MDSRRSRLDDQGSLAFAAGSPDRRAWRGNNLRLQSIFDVSPAVVFVVDNDDRYVFVNRAWELVFGKPMKDVVGRHLSEIFPDANARSMSEENRRARESDAPVECEHIFEAGGITRTFTTTKMSLLDENARPTAVCGLSIDVTQRKRSETRLRFLAKVASMLVLHGDDVDGLMAQLCRMLEVELGADVHFHFRPDTLKQRLHLSSYGGIADSTGEALEWLDYGSAVCGTVALTQQPWVINDVRGDQDARTQLIRDMSISAYMCFPLHSNGSLLGTLSMGRRQGKFDEDDVEILRIVADLISVALDRARRAHQLVEVDSNRKKFLAVLAHELRGPIAPISTAAELLIHSEANAGFVQQAASLIRRQISSLRDLVEELLDEARVSHGKITLDLKRVALAEVIDDAVEIVRAQLDARGHVLTLALPGDAVCVRGDRRRLAQVLSNLLANSAKYTPEGGHIGVQLTREGNFATLRVRDDGIGIEAELMPRIFGLFEQARAARTAAHASGMGIGLALVKAVVELHGGTIEVHSDGIGCGAEFVVSLPLDAHASAEPSTR